MVKNPPVNAGDTRDADSTCVSGRSPGGGNVNPLQSSFLENPMDRAAWWATVHGVAKSQTQLSTHTFYLKDHRLFQSFKKKNVKFYCKIPLNFCLYALGQREPWDKGLIMSLPHLEKVLKGLYLNCSLCIYKGSWPWPNHLSKRNQTSMLF